MIKSAKFKNFTVLPNDTWEFGSGLNLIVGENGVGKSHVLKAIYSVLKVTASTKQDLTKASLEKAYAAKFRKVFLPDRLGRLVTRTRGKASCSFELKMNDSKRDVSLSFGSQAEKTIQLEKSPDLSLSASPVFFPTRELVTLAGWFPQLYEQYAIGFEETYHDTTMLLGGPAVRGPKEELVKKMLKPLEEAMNGKVILDGATGRLYLKTTGGKLEMPLVAEGLRKFAMVARLISSGVLLEQGYLFWDEPETNLNPRLLKALAKTILDLTNSNIQVFVSTHSLFLMKEIELLLAKSPQSKNARFFALAVSDNEVNLEQSDTMLDMRTIVSLEEELEQSDRFLEAQ